MYEPEQLSGTDSTCTGWVWVCVCVRACERAHACVRACVCVHLSLTVASFLAGGEQRVRRV